jgi:hypothetical protein
MVHGLLASLHRKLSTGMVVRHLSPGYQVMYASAFTENTLPGNESGVYLGMSFRPGHGLTVDAYADVFSFPWLKSGTDAPAWGKEYFVQLVYKPSKKLELSSRLRAERKEVNVPANGRPVNILNLVSKLNWRTHLTWQPWPELRLRQRVELVWYDIRDGSFAEQGYLIYNDVKYDPTGSPFSLGARLQFFETDGFNSRIYAFENDVPGSYSVPAVYQKGMRYYINVGLAIKNSLKSTHRIIPCMNVYLRWAQTIYEMQAPSALQASQPELKIELIFSGS